MEIPEKLIKFKFHILAALLLCVVVSSLILVAPRFLTILAYFWPLLFSTALFLAAVLVFGKTTAASSPASSAAADKAGEGLLDFVAGQPDHHHHHHGHHDHEDRTVEGFKVEEDIASHDESRVESSNSKSE